MTLSPIQATAFDLPGGRRRLKQTAQGSAGLVTFHAITVPLGDNAAGDEYYRWETLSSTSDPLTVSLDDGLSYAVNITGTVVASGGCSSLIYGGVMAYDFCPDVATRYNFTLEYTEPGSIDAFTYADSSNYTIRLVFLEPYGDGGSIAYDVNGPVLDFNPSFGGRRRRRHLMQVRICPPTCLTNNLISLHK